MNQTNRIKLEAEISATSKGLVDALNQASSAVNSTSDTWKSRFDKLKDSTSVISQGVKNLSDLMKNVGDIDPSGIAKYNESLGEVSANFDKVKAEVDRFTQTLSEMKVEASNLNMPIEDYQRFADAVKASGVSMDEARGMIVAMQQNIQGLANGVPEAQALFDRLGVTLEQVSSNSVAANFQLLVDALNDTIPASERATQNMQLFKSSIDSTLQVAQQYQKTVSEQTNAYATDKEVQSAISLSSAIDKLGKQLNGYANTMQMVANGNAKFNKTMTEMTDEYDVHTHLLEAIIEVYGKYADNLESTSKKALETTNALKILAKESREADKVVLTDVAVEGEDVERNIDDYPFLENLVQAVSETKDSVQKEIASIQEIMSKRIASGAPIDTTELDEAMQHFASLKQVINELIDINQFVGFSTEQRNVIDDMSNLLGKADEKLRDFAKDASKLNSQFDLKKINNDVVLFRSELERAWRVVKKGGKIRLDTREVDEAIAKLQKLQQQSGVGGADYSAQLSILENFKRDMDSVNLLADRNVSRWDKVKGALRGAWNYVTHFRSGVKGANGEATKLKETFGKGIGQIMGMGSAVAVVTTAFRNLNKLSKELVSTLLDGENIDWKWLKINGDNTFAEQKNAGASADDMTRVREKAEKRNQELIAKLKEYSDLVKAERSNPSNEAMAKRRNLEDLINKEYGMNLKGSNRGDVDAEIGRQLDKLTQMRIKAIDAQIKANQRVSDGVDEFINSFEGMGGYFKKLGYTYGKGDLNGSRAIEQAQERSNKAKDETSSLIEQRRRLEHEDLRGQFERINNAKALDEATKKRKEADEKATKALEEASQKLDEWKNSLTDNDRQKNLREIMKKYEEAVRDGISSEEARKVAVLAIAKMLQKEEEDEKKKNKELLEAMEQKIEAYRNAYKEYVEADRKVREAKKDEARKIKEVAEEEHKTAIDAKRERLKKKLNRFGFRLDEDFKLTMKPSERRERRRNAQLDSSISEKLSKDRNGERVHFTHAEKERIAEFQKLQGKDKALEREKKAMEVAKKQEDAAEKLKEAAKAIKEAVYGREEARKDLGKAGSELRQASSKRRKVAKNDSPDLIFENARKSLSARGVASPYQTKQINYTTQISQLHTDLMNIQKKTYLVK